MNPHLRSYWLNFTDYSRRSLQRLPGTRREMQEPPSELEPLISNAWIPQRLAMPGKRSRVSNSLLLARRCCQLCRKTTLSIRKVAKAAFNKLKQRNATKECTKKKEKQTLQARLIACLQTHTGHERFHRRNHMCSSNCMTRNLYKMQKSTLRL